MYKILFFCILVFGSRSMGWSKVPPSKESTVEVAISGGKLFGSLRVPVKGEKFPVVLLIAGSGPTDRNGNNISMQNNSLQMIAATLGAKGIASLRYDKRGVAESANVPVKEEDMRFQDMVDDAKSWLDFLKKDKRFFHFTVMGHSEGSMIGAIVAQEADAFVSLAGPGRKADVLIREQLAFQPDNIKKPSYAILDSLAKGKTVNDVPGELAPLFRKSVQPYLISLFAIDPAESLKKLKIPVCIVQGGKDLQVKTADADALKAAYTDAVYHFFPNMNHVLKTIEGEYLENMSSYDKPNLPLQKGLPDALIAFVKLNTKKKHGTSK